MSKLNNTVRTYPRTLEEAFPQHAEYANWIDAPPQRISKFDLVVSILAVFIWIFLVYLFV